MKKKAKKKSEKVCVRDPRSGKMECYVPKKRATKKRGTSGSGCGCGG